MNALRAVPFAALLLLARVVLNFFSFRGLRPSR